MLTVGYIGLGLMGKSIARNIHKAGFPLVVHNRSRAAVEELVAEGASAAGLARRAGRAGGCGLYQPAGYAGCGKGGAGRERHPGWRTKGLIFVDNSTIKPAAARSLAAQLAERGVFSLDARSRVATSGRAMARWPSWWAARPRRWRKSALSSRRWARRSPTSGEAGAGQVAKAANQIMVAAADGGDGANC